MRKGRFGLVLCAYPILAFACVILQQPILCALVFGFALVAERDEWTGRQCLEALGLSVCAGFLRWVLTWAGDFLPDYPYFFSYLSIVLHILAALVYLGAILLSILAILRVVKEREADLPLLSSLALRAYGKQKPRPFPGSYPPPYPPQAPYGTPGGPAAGGPIPPQQPGNVPPSGPSPQNRPTDSTPRP